MRVIATLVKHWLVPGTMSFLLGGVMVGAAALNTGDVGSMAGRAWLTALAVAYWLMSLPAVAASLLAWSSTGDQPIQSADAARGARLMVVIGNGSVSYSDGRHRVDYLTRRSVYCAFEAARLYALCRPARIITSGGLTTGRSEADLLRDLLVACGVPAGSIVVESRSRTTAEQVANVTHMLEPGDQTRPLLVVTTPAHMPRVSGLFRSRGLTIVPAVTADLPYDDGRVGWRRWTPSMAALTGSASAVYELLARLGARWSTP